MTMAIKPALTNSGKVRIVQSPRTQIVQGAVTATVEVFTMQSTYQHFAKGEMVVMVATPGGTLYMTPEFAEEFAQALQTAAQKVRAANADQF